MYKYGEIEICININMYKYQYLKNMCINIK